MGNGRHYVFLQGLATLLLGSLAHRSREAGQAVRHTDLCPRETHAA
jgi:hypothetical protein